MSIFRIKFNVYLTHGAATGIGKTAVPGGSHIHTSRENANAIRVADTSRRVLQAERVEAETRDRAGLTDAVSLVFEKLVHSQALPRVYLLVPMPLVKLTFSSRVN